MSTQITIHGVTEITLGQLEKRTLPDGEEFYVRRFVIECEGIYEAQTQITLFTRHSDGAGLLIKNAEDF